MTTYAGYGSRKRRGSVTYDVYDRNNGVVDRALWKTHVCDAHDDDVRRAGTVCGEQRDVETNPPIDIRAIVSDS